MLYEGKIKFVDPQQDKEVKEHYILDAELFCDAEATLKGLYPDREVDVFSLNRSGIAEIINDKEEDVPFFRATVVDVVTDDNGKEKELKYQMLVCAHNVAEATTIVNEHLKQGYNMSLDGINKVRIVDYIKY